MKKITIILFAAFSLFIVACTSEYTDIEVVTDSDPDFKLKEYKSYAWIGSAEIVWDESGQWEPSELDADAEIRFLIDQELRNHQLTEVNENPDMLVGFVAGIDIVDVIEIKENADMVEVDFEEIPAGALVIVFIDSQTGSPVWVARATANVKIKPDVETAKKRLDYAVGNMLKMMPK